MKFTDLIPVGGTMKTKQREDILAFFQANQTASFTPCHVHHFVFPDWQLTSVRARITELTDEGRLAKTGKPIIGLYGKSVGLRKFAHEDAEQGVLL